MKLSKYNFHPNSPMAEKSQLQELVTDLYWEYEKMTSSGKETLDKIAKVLDLPTQEEMDSLIANMSDEELSL